MEDNVRAGNLLFGILPNMGIPFDSWANMANAIHIIAGLAPESTTALINKKSSLYKSIQII